MKIRVLHLITKLEFGGAQQNTLYTVEHLDTQTFEPILACGKEGFLDKHLASMPPTVKICWLRFLKREINPIWDLLAFFELTLLLAKLKPHIIHTHSSKAGILGRWAARVSGVPIVTHTFHGLGFHPYQHPRVRKLYVALEKAVAQKTTQLIYVSRENQTYAESFKIHGKNPAVIIRSGVNLEKIDRLPATTREVKRKELYIDSDQTVIVTIANLKRQKNPQDFIELARRMERRFPKVTFLFIGGGENVEPFYEASANLRYLDWREDALEILKASDIFLLTSLWEGLPRSAVEALRVGLPVCAYAIDGVKEIVRSGHNGILVRPGDLVGLAQAVEELLRNPKKMEILAKNTKSSITQEFDINTMVKQQEELYKKLARNTTYAK